MATDERDGVAVAEPANDTAVGTSDGTHEGDGHVAAQVASAVAGRAREHLPNLVHSPDPDQVTRYDRSPAAVVRLLVAMAGIVLVIALAELLPATHDALQEDLHTRVGSWAAGLGSLADAVATGASVLVIVISLGAAALSGRVRQLWISALAGLLAATVVAVFARTAGTTPSEVVGEEWQLAAIAAAMAIGAASFSVFSAPILRWSTLLIGVMTIAGVLGSEISLVARVIVLLTGQAAGAAVAVALGSASRQVTRAELLDGLDRAKLPVVELERHPGDARGSQPWTALLSTGRTVFVKITAVDELRADQLFRMWRLVRMRGAEDERSPASVRRAAEHEAFVAQRAQSAGVRTPSVIAVGTLGEEPGERGAFVVFAAVDGCTFDQDPDALDDSALRAAWSQVQVLRRAGIAHRDLRAANLLVADGEPWIIDFGFAEAAAPQDLLDRDVAELLVSTAALVGPERAVAAAVAVLGADEVACAIPWIQPLAVSTASRQALAKGDFEELRERVRAASGEGAPELPQLRRFSWKGLLSVAALGIAIWLLLPQMAEGLDLDVVLEAQPGWLAATLLASALTYVGAAISISGSVRGAVPLLPTTAAQVASSFTNRITPARVGGMALNLRYLTKQGIDGAAAATGIATSTAAGTVAHVALSLVAILWAGNTGFPGISMPSPRVIAIVVAVLVVSALTVLAVPVLRRWCLESLVPALKRSWTSFLEVLRSPRSLAMLLGGSVIVTAMNVAAFGLSLRAFGESVPWATIAVVYLAGSAVASAAPTPGGLGATEAALVGGLVVVDVPEAVAVPAVLVFRLATFWLPILPGWLSFTLMQRRGDL